MPQYEKLVWSENAKQQNNLILNKNLNKVATNAKKRQIFPK